MMYDSYKINANALELHAHLPVGFADFRRGGRGGNIQPRVKRCSFAFSSLDGTDKVENLIVLL